MALAIEAPQGDLNLPLIILYRGMPYILSSSLRPYSPRLGPLFGIRINVSGSMLMARVGGRLGSSTLAARLDQGPTDPDWVLSYPAAL